MLNIDLTKFWLVESIFSKLPIWDEQYQNNYYSAEKIRKDIQ